jgi:hypothetical protein
MTGTLKPTNKTDPAKLVVTKAEIKAISNSVFKPSALQIKAKIAFYHKVKFLQEDVSKMDVERVAHIIGDDRVINWWKIKDFVQWFRNEDEHKERVDYLYTRMLDNLEDFIVDEEQKYTPNEKLAAQKQLIELRKQMEGGDKDTEMTPEMIQKIAENIRSKRMKSTETIVVNKPSKVELPS